MNWFSFVVWEMMQRTNRGLVSGFDVYTILAGLCFVLSGIGVSFCLKFLDSVAYAYISTSAMFIAAFLSVPMLNETVTTMFVVGMLVVSCGIILHYQHKLFRKCFQRTIPLESVEIP